MKGKKLCRVKEIWGYLMGVIKITPSYFAKTLAPFHYIVPSINIQKSIKCIVCNNNKLMFNPSVDNTFIVFGRNISLIPQTCQISLCKTNSCVLNRQIEHEFVLVVARFSVGKLFISIYLLGFQKN